ncbi:hypothetical protein [Sodalis-like endosymbiont of Proechinophthirus fluctus]|uniref:hypothetical protein n=1 Tax=Sodalis-like endosymbiont of Proechinophthirus fluctus TaxID=1462730 RepID=UPI00165029AA
MSPLCFNTSAGSLPLFAVFYPGMPSEFKAMVEREIVPLLRERFDFPDQPLCLSMTVFCHGESDLANDFDGLLLPEEVVLGY